jgi:integrase/recombinase XerD
MSVIPTESPQTKRHSAAYKWWAGEEELPDPMARLRPPKVTGKLVPVFTSVELSKLERVCQGRSFAQRRDAGILSVFRATGIRLSELAGDPLPLRRCGA